jgi:hypothetical protein
VLQGPSGEASISRAEIRANDVVHPTSFFSTVFLTTPATFTSLPVHVNLRNITLVHLGLVYIEGTIKGPLTRACLGCASGLLFL